MLKLKSIRILFILFSVSVSMAQKSTLKDENLKSTKTWQNTSELATAEYSSGSTIYNNFIYTIGGMVESGNQGYQLPSNIVQYSSINSNGTLNPWMTGTPIKSNRFSLKSIAYNNFIYALGGQKYGGYPAVYNSVEYASVNIDNGSLGDWKTTNAMQEGRYSFDVVIWNGYMYAVGGTGGSYKRSVEYAKINTDGTLGAWNLTNSMGQSRGGVGALAYNGYLYAIGGWSDWDKSTGSVEYALINPDGSIGEWKLITPLPIAPRALGEFTTLVDNGYIYVFFENTKVYKVIIKSDGTLGEWNEVNFNGKFSDAVHLTENNGYAYNTGGTYTGGATGIKTVQYINLRDNHSILSFLPTSQVIGKTIDITGSGFSTTPTENSIHFTGGVTAIASASTENTLTVTVPVGAKTGKISVTSNSISSDVSEEMLTITPVISSFLPTSQVIGKTIDITGSGFSTTSTENSIHFTEGVTAIASASTENTLTVTVPVGAKTGKISVTSNSISSDVSEDSLIILPNILSFQPTSQLIGKTIEIKGADFSITATDNTVHFAGNVTAIASKATNTSLTVTIPEGALSGSIWVTSNALSSLPSEIQLITGASYIDTITFSGLIIGESTPSYSELAFNFNAENSGQPCSGYCIDAGYGPNAGSKTAFRTTRDTGTYQLTSFKLTNKYSLPFNLNSLKLKHLSGGDVHEVTFVGTYVNGKTINFTVKTEKNNYGFQNFNFPLMFRGLKSVSWYPNRTGVTEIVVSD